MKEKFTSDVMPMIDKKILIDKIVKL